MTPKDGRNIGHECIRKYNNIKVKYGVIATSAINYTSFFIDIGTWVKPKDSYNDDIKQFRKEFHIFSRDLIYEVWPKVKDYIKVIEASDAECASTCKRLNGVYSYLSLDLTLYLDKVVLDHDWHDNIELFNLYMDEWLDNQSWFDCQITRIVV
jgi:hypothetical protein